MEVLLVNVIVKLSWLLEFNNNIILQWMYLGEPGVAPTFTFPIAYTSRTSYACSAMIHNPSTEGYIPTVHIYIKSNSSIHLSLRYNGGGMGQTVYFMAIGY